MAQEVDKACNNEICMKKDECARNAAYHAGDKNYKTFGGTQTKACKNFIQK